MISQAKKWGFTCASVLVFMLAGCGDHKANIASQDDTKSGQEIENVTETRTLTDAIGNKVEVPVYPKRVIASYLG